MLYFMKLFLTLMDHREGRGGVKLNCVRSVAKGERKLPNACRYASIACRNASIRGGAFKQVLRNRSETSDFYSVVCEPVQSVPVKKTVVRARRLQRIKNSLGRVMTKSRYKFDTGFLCVFL